MLRLHCQNRNYNPLKWGRAGFPETRDQHNQREDDRVCRLLDDLVKTKRFFNWNENWLWSQYRFNGFDMVEDLLNNFTGGLNLHCLLGTSIRLQFVMLLYWISVRTRTMPSRVFPLCSPCSSSFTLHMIWEMPCRFDVNYTALGLCLACVKTTCSSFQP